MLAFTEPVIQRVSLEYVKLTGDGILVVVAGAPVDLPPVAENVNMRAELVERDHLPPDLCQRHGQARVLTAPPDHDEDSRPLSPQIGQTLLDSVHEPVSQVQE